MASCNCSDDSTGVSILESVKQDLGASEWDDAFDEELRERMAKVEASSSAHKRLDGYFGGKDRKDSKG